MKKPERTPPTLDEVVAGIRQAALESDVVEGAAARVRSRIAEQLAQAPQTRRVEDGGSIQGCAGFQALIPAYLARSLSAARTLLLEDHVHECVACRRALHEARSGGARPEAVRVRPVAARRPGFGWAMAGLAAAACVGLAVILETQFVHPQGIRATVESVDGAVYRVADAGASTLAPGASLNEGEEVRTTEGSRAVLRLADGSRVEMGERADLSVSKGWRDSTVRLERGKIIVQAAEQKSGRLYVATPDCRVAVKGTVFSVSQGTKGARVSVIQGQVEVDQGRRSRFLHAGDQMSTDSSLTAVPVGEDIAWSPNADQYLALMGEFKGLEKQFEAIPGPGLRYDSKLLGLAPENTVMYLAIPNLGGTLSQADQIFQQRIQESEVLREWWERQQASRHDKPSVEELIQKIENLSQYVGDEVVLALPADASGNYSSGVVLAEVTRPDLPQFLSSQLQELSGSKDKPAIRVIENPAALPLLQPGQAAKPDSPMAFVSNGYLVMSSDPVQLRNTAALIERSGSSRFSTTPFYSAIRQAYQSGATWLFCADLEQIIAHSVPKGGSEQASAGSATGLKDVKYLVVERKDVTGQTENRATLTFSQERRGIASWLAEPGPAGTLDFVSPDASFAASFVLKDPKSLLEELFSFASSEDPGFSQQLADFESKTGISVTNDLAGSLGGEVTVALDGPVLPTPSWKMAVEVYDPVHLESSIETLARDFSGQANSKIEVAKDQSGGRTFYTLDFTPPPRANASSPAATVEVDYTYADGYLLAAPSRALLTQSIQNRQTGYSLSRSADFRSRLPRDGYANFSAMFYHNLGPILSVVTDQLKSSTALTPAQRESIQMLSANSAPGLVCVYGEPQQIVAASTGSLFGVGLDTLFGMGAPFKLPQAIGVAADQARKNQQGRP